MTRKDGDEVCEHCQSRFEYWLCHCGMVESMYAYCDSCGKTAVLSEWDKRMPRLRDCPGQQEICAAMESYLLLCDVEVVSKKERLLDLHILSAELATSYIEANAPGSEKGWRWQRSWIGMYCIVIEDKRVMDNFRPTAPSLAKYPQCT